MLDPIRSPAEFIARRATFREAHRGVDRIRTVVAAGAFVVGMGLLLLPNRPPGLWWLALPCGPLMYAAEYWRRGRLAALTGEHGLRCPDCGESFQKVAEAYLLRTGTCPGCGRRFFDVTQVTDVP